jgi:VIT1/CCC1 family predicted Fe2+/Mn2+ transporter
MNTAVWVVTSVLSIAYLAGGAMKAARPKDALAASGLTWVEDFSPAAVKAIGTAEVLGALGLVLPVLTGIATWLIPVAATCLALLMVGAAVTHLRRKDGPGILPSLVLALLAAFVAWARFGPYALGD